MEERVDNFAQQVVMIIPIIFLAIIISRNFSERQLDDVSPEISCDEEFLKKSDILYVIPIFNGKSIADNKDWCDYILSFNKTLALHGVYHTYNEFLEDRDEAYLQKGIDAFVECFNKTPAKFKPPHWAISEKNTLMISKTMKVERIESTILHRAYHCDDTGMTSNKEVDMFSLRG